MKSKKKKVKGKTARLPKPHAQEAAALVEAATPEQDAGATADRPLVTVPLLGDVARPPKEGAARSLAGHSEPPVAPAALAVKSKPVSSKSAAMHERWRKIRAGEMRSPDQYPKPERSRPNPLFSLPEEQRAKLFAWLRECPYNDAALNMLREQGVTGIRGEHLNDFFEHEAEMHWEMRIGRAAQEANALVRLVERSPVQFSAGILAALGQEAFRQIASGQVEPEAMGKLATLFLKARSDERADQMQELRREKLRHEIEGQVEQALEKLAEEVEKNPTARVAFEELRRELAGENEEPL